MGAGLAKLNALQGSKIGHRDLVTGPIGPKPGWMLYCKIAETLHSSGGITEKGSLLVRSPDPTLRSTKKEHWINDRSTVQLVTQALAGKALFMKVGRASFASGPSLGGTGHGVVQNKPERNDYHWAALISRHTRCGQGRQALSAYEAMRKEGVDPSSRTFVAVLKACSSLQDLEAARKIHEDVVTSGLESDLYVGTMVVDVYAKCRSLVDARHAFEKMPSRNVVSWTAMIFGYAQMEKGKEALQLYSRMQQECVTPNDRTYVSVLKACSTMAESGERDQMDGKPMKQRCLETVRAIHADIVKRNFESDVFVGTMLVDAYAKCESLEDARCVFEKMPAHTVVSWTAMIFGYCQMDRGEEALQLYTRMIQEGVVPDGRTYVSALKACSTIAQSGHKIDSDGVALQAKCLETVRDIHKDVLKRKVWSSVFVRTMLVDAYAKCGSLEDARCIFEKMPARTVVSWTAMILGYAQVEKGVEALELYDRMQQEGVVPDAATYVSALKACTNMAEWRRREGDAGEPVKERCLDRVKAIHKAVAKGHCVYGVFLGTMLIGAYAKCGSLEEARWVFESMPRRDVASWNTMMLSYAQMDKGEEALQLYSRMQQEGMVPDGHTYVSALKACSTLSVLHGRTQDHSIAATERCLLMVRAIHRAVEQGRLGSGVIVGTMLIDAYSKCGSLGDARRVFEKMPHRDVASWNAIVMGYAQMGMGTEALQLYGQMLQDGVVPDDRTYVGALTACGTVVGLEKGKEIHAQILKAGLVATDLFVAGSLISMYGKCGSMIHAEQVFEAMPQRGIVAWNALIAGYALQGDTKFLFDLFQRINQDGLQPDGVTFLGVLTVCCRVGLLDIGLNFFKAMVRDFGIVPTLKHFTCLVDLLGRAGQLKEAMEIVKTMPFQPNVEVWECVLGACRKWGDVDTGRKAFECAVRLIEDDAAAYVVMSDIYAAAHMWEDANEIQAWRKKSRARKQPGWSQWTDLSGHAHLFVVGDEEHPETQAIYQKLGHLRLKMKADVE